MKRFKVNIISSGSKGNCYLISVDNDALILDAGVKFIDIINKVDINNLNFRGLFITHEHGDHSKYIDDFIIHGIDVYGSKAVFNKLGIKSKYVNYISADDKIPIDPFEIHPFSLNHDSVENFGYFILHKSAGSILYITDTNSIDYIPPKTPNILLLESNYDEETIDSLMSEGYDYRNRVIKTHLSIQKAVNYISKFNYLEIDKIYLIHLSENNADKNKFKELVETKFGVPTYVEN